MHSKKIPKPKSYSDQVCSGIEQLALGLYFFERYPKEKFPMDKMMNLLEKNKTKIQTKKPKEEQKNENNKGYAINRNYLNHRDKLFKEFGIKLDFQKKQPKNFKKHEKKAFELFHFYLLKYSLRYSHSIVENYIKFYRELNRLEYALYIIVAIRLSIQFNLTLDIVYDSAHSKFKNKSFRLQPLEIVCVNNYLQLIAFDVSDKKQKHFTLHTIKEIKTEVLNYSDQESRDKPNFTYESFIQSNDYKEKRKEIPYQLKILNKNLMNKLHAFFPEYKIIKERKNSIIIETKTHREKYFFCAVFYFKNEIEILSPSKEKFKQYLQSILEVYS